MSVRLVIAAALTLSLLSCTPKRNEASSVTQPDAMPTTRDAWLRTAQHDPVWYSNHKTERRALLKDCDKHNLRTPDCSNAHSGALGAGDF